jgi:hypothetical protein
VSDYPRGFRSKPKIWNINVGNLRRDMGIVDEMLGTHESISIILETIEAI